MTFGQTYRALTVKEWRDDFLDYERLRSIVFAMRGKQKKSILSKLFVRSQASARSKQKKQDGIDAYKHRDDQFVKSLTSEVEKVQNFFDKKKEELLARQVVLEEQQSVLEQTYGKSTTIGQVKMLQKAWEEHYKSLKLLDHYRTLNITAIVRVIHKYESTEKINTDYAQRITEHGFCTNDSIKEMMKSVEALLQEEPYDLKADQVKNMLNLEKHTLHRTKQVYSSGVLSGLSFLLITICLFLYFTHYPQDPAHKAPYTDQMLDLYKILIFTIFLLFLVSLNIFIWIKANINYQFILKIEPRPYFGKWYCLCFSLSMFVTAMMSLSFFLLCAGYESRGFEGFSPTWVHPLVLYIIILAWMLFPFRFFFAHIRFWILGSLWRCICAPFAKVQFQDIFMADMLTSMGDVLFEVQFAACLFPLQQYSSMYSICERGKLLGLPIFNLLPFWIRFWQCIRRYIDTRGKPNLINAGKYMSSIIVIILAFADKMMPPDPHHFFTPMKYTWLFANVISTFYKAAWDFMMDWGLFWNLRGEKTSILRNDTLFHPLAYFAAILFNLIVRTSWILALLLRVFFEKSPTWVSLLLIGAEIFRRFIWNIFRLELEQLSEGYRVVNDLPLPFAHGALPHVDLDSVHKPDPAKDKPWIEWLKSKWLRNVNSPKKSSFFSLREEMPVPFEVTAEMRDQIQTNNTPTVYISPESSVNTPGEETDALLK